MADGTLEDCFRTLGLRPSAAGAEIKRAFRQLVKRHHPDLQNREEGDHEAFLRIVAAYQRLRQELRLHEADAPLRRCPVCGRAAELFDGADGRAACVDCLLGVTQRRHLLPLPSLTPVKHITVIVLEGMSLGCFGLALLEDSRAYALAALAFGVASLGLLALTCIIVKRVARRGPPKAANGA